MRVAFAGFILPYTQNRGSTVSSFVSSRPPAGNRMTPTLNQGTSGALQGVKVIHKKLSAEVSDCLAAPQRYVTLQWMSTCHFVDGYTSDEV